MNKLTVLFLVVVMLAGGFFVFRMMRPTESKETDLSQLPVGTPESTKQPSQPPQESTQPPQQTTKMNYTEAILHTNKGDIAIQFLPGQAPNTVANFEKLANSNFYDNVKFHRVIKGFMIQTGDPLTKDDSQMARWGTGGPGYTFADELGPNNHDVKGTVAMANAGPDTNGSQFFINLVDNNFLDGKHTVFGKVVSGMDVVEAIGSVQTDSSDRPVDPVVIQSVELK